MQTAIPCMVMRGGTSKGLYFLASDLPTDPAARDQLLLAAMGSPDGRQIDGMGGAHPLTSKVAIVSASTDPDTDVDYLFLQVVVDKAEVSAAQNCGNILAAVGPFAIERGLVAVNADTTNVRIYMVNTGARAIARVETPNGQVNYQGEARIDGVPGSAAPVPIDFLDIVPKDIVEAAEDDHRRLRVGHGSLIHVSSELLQAYAERKICLEVCLSANNRIGLPHDTRELEIGQKVANQNGTSVTADNKLQDYFNSLADHPLPIFEERGIPVVLGSDNPLLLNTNIAKEYSLAVAKAGYAGDPLEFTKTAVEYANVDWETRESLRRQIAKYEMLRH
mgnify:CR=1 FL=1